ncbi:sarcosine oxidase subunit gamma [Spirillospora sp. NBC_00431]
MTAIADGPVRLREIPFPAQVEWRPDDEHALPSTPLPRPGRVTGTGDPYVLWLGPGWYLLIGRAGRAHGLLDGLSGSAVDVSAARTVLELSGPSARAVLAHGCPLDLHPRAFGPGRCARTLLAQTQMILHQTAHDRYRVLVGTSYADYAVRRLLDAMTEYL